MSRDLYNMFWCTNQCATLRYAVNQKTITLKIALQY